ncbi:MAG: energy transducer TonB [Terriglobales bacterium]
MSDVGLWASLKGNLRDFFASKQAPLRLTSRPLTPQELASPGAFNLVGVQQVHDQGLLSRLSDDVRNALFPPKQPPLHLTSKPVKVREIWGEYNLYKKQGAIGSAVVHVLMFGAVLSMSWVGWKTTRQHVQPQQTYQNVELVLPSDITLPVSSKKNDTLAGGGGGGDRDKLPAPKGRLPKFALEQFTPPAVVIRNSNPKLPMEPTVVMPPQVKLPIQNNLPNLGDPLSKVALSVPSNGTGSGGGIGSGHGGGVGSGEGGGVGPGSGGGFGGGVFRVGGGVSAPRVLDAPDPDYSEEARKAKYQGTCILWLIVGPDGRPRDIKIARTLGMGLDEKAIEAVRRWKFEPAMKDGRPVAVQINVEVNFRLY